MNELRSVLRGAAPLTATEMLSLLLAFVTLPYLMRTLGPAAFGRYAFGVAAAAALMACIDFGFNQLGPKLVARAHADLKGQSDIFWAVQLARVQLGALALLGLGLLIWLLELHLSYGAVLLAAAAGAVSAVLFPQWYLQGAQRYRTLATSLAVARTVSAVGTLLLVKAPQHAALAVLLQVLIGCWAGVAAAFDRGYRDGIGRGQLPWAASWRHLRLAAPLFMSTAAVSLYTTCVPMLVGYLTTPTTLGLFSVGDKIRAAVQTLLAPIGVAAFPKFSVWLREDRSRGLAAAAQVMALQATLGLAAAAAIFALAEPAIRLIAGPQFLPAVPVAQLLGLCIVFTAISNTLGVQLMLPLNMDGAYSALLSVCACVGMLAVWVLVQVWAERGAALALVVTEGLVAVLMGLYLRHKKVI